MSAEGAGDGRGAVVVGRLRGVGLDPLEAFCAENMGALQRAGRLVELVVLLVADGTLGLRGLFRGGSGLCLVRSLGSIPRHCWRKSLNASVMRGVAFAGNFFNEEKQNLWRGNKVKFMRPSVLQLVTHLLCFINRYRGPMSHGDHS